MKTVITLICMLSLGTTLVFTDFNKMFKDLVDSTNMLINLNDETDIEPVENHLDHNDIVRINGKTLCVKTERFYRTK